MAKTDRTRQLTGEQESALDLLVTGRSDREVAEALGIPRQTVAEWRNRDALFAAELNARRNALWRGYLDRMRSMVGRALDELEAGLGEQDPKVRQAAALHILKLATGPGTPGGINSVPNAPETPSQIERDWTFRDMA